MELIMSAPNGHLLLRFLLPTLLMLMLSMDLTCLSHPVSLSEKEIATLKGRKAAVLAVHMEGNLGDMMETIPLLKRLQEWGVKVDCYLSFWQGMGEENLDKRLNPKIGKALSKYYENIFHATEDFMTTSLRNRNYDVTIVAPGPAVNERRSCIGDGRRPGNHPEENIGCICTCT